MKIPEDFNGRGDGLYILPCFGNSCSVKSDDSCKLEALRSYLEISMLFGRDERLYHIEVLEGFRVIMTLSFM